MSRISVAVISSSVSKIPRTIAYSFIFDEAYRLSLRGVNVYIVRSKFEKDSISYGMHYYGLKRIFDIQAIKLILRSFITYPPALLLRNPAIVYWENLYASNVIRVINREFIDIIHSHFAYHEGLIGLIAKRNTGKPLVVTVHGYDILVEPSVNYGVRLNPVIDSIIRMVLNGADAIIAASTATFNEVRKIVNKPNRVYLIPNGVDIKKFNPYLDGSYIKSKLRIGNYKVVFALRAHKPNYGLEFLIKAIPLVVNKRKDVIFIIGGDGPLRKFHEQLVVKLGIGDRVIFTGWISREEVPYYYAISDIVVVPSIQEAFGLVVSEAMACGKPVVGTKVGGIPDQIIDGYNGFLVPPKDPEALAERVLWLLEHQEEAKLMGMRGREIVERKFNIDRRIDRIISLYEKLVE